jgi:hypothetical protein
MLRSEMVDPSSPSVPVHRGSMFGKPEHPHRGSVSSTVGNTNNGFSHTAWYVAGSSGLLQKLTGRKGVLPGDAFSSSTTSNVDLDDKTINRKNGKAVANNTTTSSLSQVYAISSKSPRSDIDNVQVRATIRAIIT